MLLACDINASKNNQCSPFKKTEIYTNLTVFRYHPGPA